MHQKICRTEAEEVEEATGRETIIIINANDDDRHRPPPLPPRVRFVCFTRATFNSALASRLVFLKERERKRERERERDRIPLLEFLSRCVVFSLLLCFFLSRSLGFALLTRATNNAFSVSHRTTIPKIFRMAHRETALRQALRRG